MKIAAAPISWGVCEVPGWGAQLPPERVLAEAARLGFTAVEAGPEGFLPADPLAARRLLAAHELRLVGGFVAAVLHVEQRRAQELDAVEQRATWLAAAGGEVLVLAAASGRGDFEQGTELDERGWSTLATSLAQAGELATRHGLTLAVHPHVGAAIERREHVERFLERSALGLCLDTGHLVVGGADPVALAREATARIAHVHLKDVDAALAEAVRAGRLGYAAAVRRGLYRPLGEGDARIDEVLASLEAHGYEGWSVLEQDVALADEREDPAPSIERSLAFVTAHAGL